MTLFYPYYEFDADIAIKEKRGILIKKLETKIINTRLMVDAYINALVDIQQFSSVNKILHVPTHISEDEIQAFKMLLSVGSTTVAGLASLLNCSESKARKLLQGLTARGLVKQTKSDRRIVYTPAKNIPHPSTLTSISSICELNFGEPSSGEVLSPIISVNDAEKLLKIIWDIKLKSYRLVYYPFYVWKTHEKEGEVSLVAVDGLTGNDNDYISEILAKTILFQE